MSLREKELPRVVFVKSRKEGGINAIYDPNSDGFHYQIFIHSLLPYREEYTETFESFEKARSHAAKFFSEWEMLSWDLKTSRPCEEGGKECGSGDCDTCQSIKAEGGATPFDQENASSCGACGG